MTQDEFDRRFYRIAKVAMGLMLVGLALAIVVGLPAFALGYIGPFFLATAIVILGGCVGVSNFAHDIFCNPRWKR